MNYNILRFISSTVLTALSLLIFSGCNNHAQPVIEQEHDSYINFAIEDVIMSNEEDYQSIGTVYKLDMKSKNVSEIFRFPLNAMSVKGVYDEQTDSVYYSKERNNNSLERAHVGDQIFVHDFTTNTDTMLTDDLIAVNDMIPVDEKTVFFLGARKDGLLALGKVNPKTRKVQYWKEPAPLTTKSICVDRVQKRVYAAVFDDEAKYQSMRTNGPEPDYILYSYNYNLADRREILRQEKGRISGLCARDDKLFIQYDSSDKLIDAQTKEVLFESKQDFSEERCFSEDGKGIYCFLDNESETDEKSGAQASGIYYFDFETQDYTPVFTKEGVNWPLQPNFQLMPSGVKQ